MALVPGHREGAIARHNKMPPRAYASKLNTYNALLSLGRFLVDERQLPPNAMVYAGLRVGEVSNLRQQDVDLEARVLTVRHGKGGKDRRVGIGNALHGRLMDYMRVRPGGETFFLSEKGEPFDGNKLAKRMKLLSGRLGVDITCHGLRRTFATLAAGQGRSSHLVMRT